MSNTTCTFGSARSEDLHNIVGAALFALGTGARGVRIDLPAIETFRLRFRDQIRRALKDGDWRRNWREEEAYLAAHVAAVGKRAAHLAAEEGREWITKQDLELAMVKVRGHLPIAGRWSPV
jgi:histone H3/H4